jgi:hypothetical protein
MTEEGILFQGSSRWESQISSELAENLTYA